MTCKACAITACYIPSNCNKGIDINSMLIKYLSRNMCTIYRYAAQKQLMPNRSQQLRFMQNFIVGYESLILCPLR